MQSKFAYYIICVVSNFLLGNRVSNAQLSDTEFNELHQSLSNHEEDWHAIPWHTSLIEAQRLAAFEQKPIFIWAMDGHPLGCT